MKLRAVKVSEEAFLADESQVDLRQDEVNELKEDGYHPDDQPSSETEGEQIINVSRSSTIADVKQKLAEIEGCELSKLFVFFRGMQVKDDWHLGTNLPQGECLVYTVSSRPPHEMRIVGLRALKELALSRQKAIQATLQEVQSGFRAGKQPELAVEGSGGTYFLCNDRGKRVACFKPQDEEPSAVNNPRKISTAGLRDGVRPGEAVEREVAAFITDQEGFSSVPETIMVELAHPVFNYQGSQVFAKKGSLQRFVLGDCASDYSPHLFPVDEVHKIGILDIRLLNADRNDANLLVQRVPKTSATELFAAAAGELSIQQETKAGSPLRKARSCSASSALDFEYKLIPIDHGYCLPDRLQVSWCDLCWLDWPQSRKPFSEATKEWVRNYDIEANVDRLRRELNVREPCLKLVRIAGILLKKGVEAGLCLHDIASILVRQDIDSPSVLEKQIARSAELANMMLRNARVKGFAFGTGSASSPRNAEESFEARRKSPRRHAALTQTTLPEIKDDWLDFSTTGIPVYETGISLQLPARKKADSETESKNDAAASHTPSTTASTSSVGSSLTPRASLTTSRDEQGTKPFKTRRRRASSPSGMRSSLLRVNSGHNVLSLASDKENSRYANVFASSKDDSKSKSLKKFGPTRHSEPERMPRIDSSQAFLNKDGNPASTLLSPDPFQVQQEDSATRLEEYFFEYLERLLDDVIICVQNHRKRDNSLFRRASSLHLTSPHRTEPSNLVRATRYGSMPTFFPSTGEDEGSPSSKKNQTLLRTVDGAEVACSDFLVKASQIEISTLPNSGYPALTSSASSPLPSTSLSSTKPAVSRSRRPMRGMSSALASIGGKLSISNQSKNKKQSSSEKPGLPPLAPLQHATHWGGTNSELPRLLPKSQ